SVTGAPIMIKCCGNIKNQTNVRAIVGGCRFAGAILSDGSVKGWGVSPAGDGNKIAGIELIAASANVRAFTCTISGDGGSSPLCAMEGDGSIKVVAPSIFTTDPITEQFNFLTMASEDATLSNLAVDGYN